MFMTLAHAIALAEARSCLAALADTASDIYQSNHYERLLVDLDGLHPIGPGLAPTTGTKAELLDRLEAAVDQMIDLGGDGLNLELLLTGAFEAAGFPQANDSNVCLSVVADSVPPHGASTHLITRRVLGLLAYHIT